MSNLLLDLTSFVAQALVTGLWQGVALILAVALALGLVPKLKAAFRFSVWALTFTAVAVLPLLRIFSAGKSVPEPTGTIHFASVWAIALCVLWLAAIIVRAAQLLHQAKRVRTIWKNASPVMGHDATKLLLEEVSREPGRRPELCTSAHVDAPCVIGFLSPRLLVPEWLLPELSEVDLRHIVLHECEHLRRRDDWINLFQKVTLVLLPFNLALFFADRRLSVERELACDAGVIAATGAPFDYATCLANLAERRMVGRSGLALALSAWDRRRSELAHRIHRLLKPVGTMSAWRVRGALSLLLLALAGGTMELTRTPHFISFAGPSTLSLANNVPTVLSPAVRALDAAAPAQHVTAMRVVFHPSAQGATERMILFGKRRHAVRNQRISQGRHALSGTAAADEVTWSEPRVLSADLLDRRRAKAVPSAHVVLTEFSPTYAAVPFADGWLIIQL